MSCVFVSFPLPLFASSHFADDGCALSLLAGSVLSPLGLPDKEGVNERGEGQQGTRHKEEGKETTKRERVERRTQQEVEMGDGKGRKVNAKRWRTRVKEREAKEAWFVGEDWKRGKERKRDGVEVSIRQRPVL